MPQPKVVAFGEGSHGGTFADALTFIERTRRQLDRFDVLPHAPGQAIADDDAAIIRKMCDELEADIKRSLGE